LECKPSAEKPNEIKLPEEHELRVRSTFFGNKQDKQSHQHHQYHYRHLEAVTNRSARAALFSFPLKVVVHADLVLAVADWTPQRLV